MNYSHLTVLPSPGNHAFYGGINFPHGRTIQVREIRKKIPRSLRRSVPGWSQSPLSEQVQLRRLWSWQAESAFRWTHHLWEASWQPIFQPRHVPTFWCRTMKKWRFLIVLPGWWWLEHVLFVDILKIIIPIDSYFSEGLKPPTSYCVRWLAINDAKLWFIRVYVDTARGVTVWISMSIFNQMPWTNHVSCSIYGI